MKKTVLPALFSLVMPMSLYALGLGDMKVESALDQPFKAEIELIDINNTSLKNIAVGLADDEHFERVGVKRVSALSLLHFTIGKNDQGKAIIKIQSVDRFIEPYIQLVIDLSWPGGQLNRFYTALLDPPGYQLATSTVGSSSTDDTKARNYSEPVVINKSVTTNDKGSTNHVLAPAYNNGQISHERPFVQNLKTPALPKFNGQVPLAQDIHSQLKSNILLMEQLHLLQDQNKKLQKLLDEREKDMDLIRTQLQAMMKERMAIASQHSLEDVMKYGSESQKEQAKVLLQEINGK